MLKGVLLPNTWVSHQHKYRKYGGCEPVASKKITLGQVVPEKIAQKEMYLLKKPIANLHMTVMSNFM